VKKIIIISILLLFANVYADDELQNVCREYEKAMKSIPHITTGVDLDTYFNTYDGKTLHGCTAEVSTKWSLVGEDFDQSKVLELPGWKNGDFAADGPGTSMYEMIKDKMFCHVGFNFSSYIDEKTGDLVMGDDLDMYANCAYKK
jgi:hypothetical protein